MAALLPLVVSVLFLALCLVHLLVLGLESRQDVSAQKDQRAEAICHASGMEFSVLHNRRKGHDTVRACVVSDDMLLEDR